ncbi:MAG: TRAP transporter substrate-binding protein DctP [Mesorhizobium sp.]|nr:TRAP transporter substrate-binding protein DctP [Mesorhizobium sp.]
MPILSRRSLVSIMAGAAAMVTLPMVAHADTVTWRVQSHWPQASSSYGDSLEYLRDVLAERSDGRFQLELHPAGSLFGHDEIFNSVRRGIIPMGTISPAYIIGEVTTAGIANGLPNAFQETWEAAYFFKHLGFEDMIREEVAEQGVFYATDKVYPTEMVLSRKPESLEDFRSLSIRSSGTLQSFLTNSGAAATMVAGPELYQALSSGVVDGAHWGAVQGALSMSLYEVAKYHVRPPLNIGGIDAFVVNQEAIDELPDDLQQILYSALEEQFWRRTNEYIYQEQVALARAQAEQDVEVIELPEDVRQAMLEAARTSWQAERDKGGKAAEAMDMLEEFLGELGHL